MFILFFILMVSLPYKNYDVTNKMIRSSISKCDLIMSRQHGVSHKPDKGVSEDEYVIFFSVSQNPSSFPYPNKNEYVISYSLLPKSILLDCHLHYYIVVMATIKVIIVVVITAVVITIIVTTIIIVFITIIIIVIISNTNILIVVTTIATVTIVTFPITIVTTAIV